MYILFYFCHCSLQRAVYTALLPCRCAAEDFEMDPGADSTTNCNQSEGMESLGWVVSLIFILWYDFQKIPVFAVFHGIFQYQYFSITGGGGFSN